uniref:Major capsid protein n=1 Tax=Anthurium amnicola TaxID=1678845 RepID=A0A1D1YQI2_9ARAE
MGQALNKLRGQKVEQEGKVNKKLQDIATNYIDRNYDKFESLMEGSTQKENLFYHFVYEIVEGINTECGAMQYKMPKYEELQKIFKEVHPDSKKDLTKMEFQKIFDKVVGLDNLTVGQGFKDMVLYTIGFPVVAALVKSVILPKAIPDELFIPAITSATVVYLAKANKL